MDIHAKIRARIEAFVTDVSKLVQSETAEAVRNAVPARTSGRGPGRPAGSKAKSSAPAASPKRAVRARRRAGEKRDPSEIAGLITQVETYVADHPGVRVEQIGKGLKIPTRDLKLPILKLLEEKRLHRQGQRRGTKYFV